MSVLLRRTFLGVLFALLAALGPRAAFAQSMTLDRFEVALWPEFDKPDVLVMYRVHIASTVNLPATLRLAIPTAAGMPHAVAKRGGDGTLYLADYVPTPQGDLTWLDITTDSADVQVEYYTPLAKEGTHRAFTWQWPGGPEVKSLAYEVLQPAGAQGFQVTPPPTGETVADSGLKSATGELGNVASGTAATVSFSYDKANDALTKDAMAIAQMAAQQPAAPAAAPAAPVLPTAQTQAPASTNWWFITAGALVVVWLGWALFKPVKKDS